MNLHLFSLCSFVLLRLSNLSLAAIVQITGALNNQMGLVTLIMTVSVKLKFFEVCGPVFDEVATVSAFGEFWTFWFCCSTHLKYRNRLCVNKVRDSAKTLVCISHSSISSWSRFTYALLIFSSVTFQSPPTSGTLSNDHEVKYCWSPGELRNLDNSRAAEALIVEFSSLSTAHCWLSVTKFITSTTEVSRRVALVL